MSEINFSNELRKLLILKITRDWHKWLLRGYGNGFSGMEKLPSKRQFYLDLQWEIRESISGRMGAEWATELMPSISTLRRF